MATALLGIGSNIDPSRHLLAAAKALKEAFGSVMFSSVYQSQAIGMDGADFLNACCLVHHVDSHAELVLWCKSLEDQHGRDRSQGSWKPRTLDLDILMFNGEVLDRDIYAYAHVAVPAAELVAFAEPAPLAKHLPLRKVKLIL